MASPDSPAPAPSPSPWLPVIGKSLMIAALVIVVVALWSAWDHDAFITWKEQAGPVPFFLAMALLPALGVPITPFFILAGATFGIRVGLVGSLLAMLANFSLCFWLARSGLRPFIARMLARFSVKLPNFDGRREGVLRFVWLVKLTPGVPAFTKNYLMGVANVPFRLYLVVSMLVSGVYAAAFVVLGESALERDATRLLAAVAVIVVAGLCFWWWRRRRLVSAGSESG